jgi:hypothetical protein
MTTIDRGNEPLMQACSSNLPAVPRRVELA